MGLRAVPMLAIAACGGRGGPAPDGGGGDASGTAITVTGRVVLREVRCTDATRVPSTNDAPLPDLTASVVGSGGPIEVPIASDGTFSFPAAVGAPYRLTTTTELGTTEYQLDATALDLAPSVIGRYPRTPAPAGTTLTAQVAGAPTTGVAVIASVGLWTQFARTSGTNAAFTVAWSQAGSISGPVGLLDASAYDRAYWTVFASTGSPAYPATTYACSEDFTMVAGTANTLHCTATAVPFDRCIHLVAHAADETARLAAAAPRAYTSAAWQWVVLAVPAPVLGPVGGLTIAYNTLSTTTDLDRQIMFGVPFPGHDVSLMMRHLRSRAIALGAAAGLTIYAVTEQLVRPAADCATPTDVAGTVAIPTAPALDGVTLEADGLELALDRAQPHVLTWDLAAPGAADFWQVTLYEVTAPANQTTLTVNRQWVTTARSIALDPALLEKGSTYLVAVSAVVGFPNAAHGDLRTVGYPASPYALSSIPSGTFLVSE